MTDDKKAILGQIIESLTELKGTIYTDACKMMTDADTLSTTSGGFYESALQALRIASEKVAKQGQTLSDELFGVLATLRKLSNDIDDLRKSSELVQNFYEAGYELSKSVNKLPD